MKKYFYSKICFKVFKIKTSQCFSVQKWLCKLAAYVEVPSCGQVLGNLVPGNLLLVRRAFDIQCHIACLKGFVFSCVSLVCCTHFLLFSSSFSVSFPYLTSLFSPTVYFLFFHCFCISYCFRSSIFISFMRKFPNFRLKVSLEHCHVSKRILF